MKSNLLLLLKYIIKQKSFKFKFETIEDAFRLMPYGLNRKIAKNVDVIVQFNLTGKETQNSYLIIKNQQCQYIKGIHSNPTVIIEADSKLWLNIINKEIDATKAYLEGRYKISKDISIMLDFDKLFDKSAKKNYIEDYKQDYEYKTISSKKIKNIIVFDGGPRNKKFSKTTFMVNHFCNGAKSVGANVEVYKLSKFDFKPCIGCYMCWTKTAGKCIHKDIMNELMMKYRKADLVVFASPLYIFSVTSIMKNFMDRLLPVLKPYMIINEKNNYIMHPDRFPNFKEQGILVFSASGFPNIDNNFDGLKGIYRNWDSHNENSHLLGEFFLTASETITLPIYKKRKDQIAKSCYEAGIQVVNEGKIDYKYMSAISNPTITNQTFIDQANHFWSTLDGKKSYYNQTNKI
jgi:putative sterol carrier protein